MSWPPHMTLSELILGLRPRIRKRGPIIQRSRTCPPPKKTYKASGRAVQDHRPGWSGRIRFRIPCSKDRYEGSMCAQEDEKGDTCKDG